MQRNSESQEVTRTLDERIMVSILGWQYDDFTKSWASASEYEG